MIHIISAWNIALTCRNPIWTKKEKWVISRKRHCPKKDCIRHLWENARYYFSPGIHVQRSEWSLKNSKIKDEECRFGSIKKKSGREGERGKEREKEGGESKKEFIITPEPLTCSSLEKCVLEWRRSERERERERLACVLFTLDYFLSWHIQKRDEKE